MLTVLVTGGAGYIGSHTVRVLKRAGYGVVVYDNFIRGHREAVEDFKVVEGDTADTGLLIKVLKEQKIDAVMHFAAHSQVGESVEKPALYYDNNVIGGLKLLDAVLEAGIKYFIFSSSAAVYGDPDRVPISEGHPLKPTNPYGETKAIIEKALDYYDQAYGLKSASLRYFNAAGAAVEGGIGEDHDPETHLIPLALKAVLDQDKPLTIFGDDYPTVDGTAVRDYIHVEDLADAHLLALEALVKGKASRVYNLGNGSGFSVLEVIRAAEQVTGRKVTYTIGPRREGDPAVLVAAAEKAKTELGWQPRYASLEKIIETAWRWHRTKPDGYGMVTESIGVNNREYKRKNLTDTIKKESLLVRDESLLVQKELEGIEDE
jgi:UDP-glucose-4-epimerase GalE